MAPRASRSPSNGVGVAGQAFRDGPERQVAHHLGEVAQPPRKRLQNREGDTGMPAAEIKEVGAPEEEDARGLRRDRGGDVPYRGRRVAPRRGWLPDPRCGTPARVRAATPAGSRRALGDDEEAVTRLALLEEDAIGAERPRCASDRKLA